jgi:hypothetical protein
MSVGLDLINKVAHNSHYDGGVTDLRCLPELFLGSCCMGALLALLFFTLLRNAFRFACIVIARCAVLLFLTPLFTSEALSKNTFRLSSFSFARCALSAFSFNRASSSSRDRTRIRRRIPSMPRRFDLVFIT